MIPITIIAITPKKTPPTIIPIGINASEIIIQSIFLKLITLWKSEVTNKGLFLENFKSISLLKVVKLKNLTQYQLAAQLLVLALLFQK